MTGLHFSANSLPQPNFGAIRPRFGSDEDSTEKMEKDTKPEVIQPANDDAFVTQQSDKKPSEKAEDPVKQDASPKAAAKKNDDIEAAQSASKVTGLDEQPPVEESPEIIQQETTKKDSKFWIKSAAISAVSLGLLAASLGFLVLPGGFIVSTGLALGAFLLHDYANHFSRKSGLLNITDPEHLKSFILERGQRPMEIFARVRHPLNPEKQVLLVNQFMHQVNRFDPHKQLSRTGLDYQSTLDKMKAETSYLSKTFILGRFLFAAAIKRGLFRYMQGKGRFIAWALPLAWAWITGNQHGKLDDPPPQAPQAVKPFAASKPMRTFG